MKAGSRVAFRALMDKGTQAIVTEEMRLLKKNKKRETRKLKTVAQSALNYLGLSMLINMKQRGLNYNPYKYGDSKKNQESWIQILALVCRCNT
jgi:hypothetical protein